MIVYLDFKRLKKMKKERDIFDLFRENQHKLSQKPSPQTWQKLENRLNRRNLHSGMTSWFSIAAALLLLVGVIGLLTLFANPQKQDLASSPVKPVLEDLQLSNHSQEMLQAVEFCRLYCKPGSQKIQEGTTGQRLVVNRQVLRGG